MDDDESFSDEEKLASDEIESLARDDRDVRLVGSVVQARASHMVCAVLYNPRARRFVVASAREL